MKSPIMNIPLSHSLRRNASPCPAPAFHARVLEGVAKSQSPLKRQEPCPDTVSLDLDPLLHSGVVAPAPTGPLPEERLSPLSLSHTHSVSLSPSPLSLTHTHTHTLSLTLTLETRRRTRLRRRLILHPVFEAHRILYHSA